MTNTLPPPKILNYCNTCGKDFKSVSAFDQHRTGTFEYDYSQGVKMDPPREDGRRCMSTDEMRVKGMEQDKFGRWRKPLDEAGRQWLQTVNTKESE